MAMIPLYKPFMPNLPDIITILNSGNLSYGNYGRLFESSLRKFLNSEYVLTTNSFNSAINVIITVLDLKAGDKVVASPMACLASNQPLLAFGLDILWCDIDSNLGTLDPVYLKKLLESNKIKAIFHNHYAGIIGKVDEINSIAAKYNVPVIDDAIEAFGGEYKGKKIGNLGSYATLFSFGPVRIPNTLDGGAIVFGDLDSYNKGLLIRDTGIDRTTFRSSNGEISHLSDITLPGHSAMLDEIRSYIGYQQMISIDEIIAQQRSNAEKWNLLAIKYGFTPIKSDYSNFNYWVFPVLVNDKNSFIKKMNELGFSSSTIHYPNNRYSAFNNYQNLIGVNGFYTKFLALPCGWWVQDSDLDVHIDNV